MAGMLLLYSASLFCIKGLDTEGGYRVARSVSGYRTLLLAVVERGRE